LFEGDIYHASFDCPKPLAKAFKKATHDNGTSICKELQKYMLIYVTADHAEKTAYGNTLCKVLKPKIAIGELNFEQYCQTKPRRWIQKKPEEVRGVDNQGEKFEFCEIGRCKNRAVAVMRYKNNSRSYRVCEIHLNEYLKITRSPWVFERKIDYSQTGGKSDA
jgi:hypothetical protein